MPLETVTILGRNAYGNKVATITFLNGNSLTYALTLCCNASDKGIETGVVCRACYRADGMGDMWDTTIATPADKHGNLVAEEGVSRCSCGSKYWENDKCVDCKFPADQLA